ncbi:molybdenum cofactor guanylyltransferase [Ilyobacter polytropus]|uniref:Probable molybdenum cofactor guanylyltransferase n=1 Tax=Ilyobacter polytropus (strain ATCC 51220 / DSM 2926 / LMG 16218 / CuHBu1) TaxID=572544 RepID=E3H6Q4_ILYPC|nr:molybdenum cofactor guanylyltransferase [Ilyobacter polytropus]ADO82423.1 molybdopterin-guanine dinucleotide biosynthesis protein [Ilyobacter polytropus DSM 2926]
MSRYKKTAVILAGGEGSRMGHIDKAFLKYNGKTFIQCILEKVDGYEEILIVSNSPEKYKDHKIKVVEDRVKGIGPLGGIYTGLINSSYDEVLILSCDTPFQNRNFLKYLGEMSGDYKVALPVHREGREPLTALYKKSLIGDIEKLIESKMHKIAFLYDNNPVKKVDIDKLPENIDIKNGFRNINTIEELREVGGEKE